MAIRMSTPVTVIASQTFHMEYPRAPTTRLKANGRGENFPVVVDHQRLQLVVDKSW